MAKRANTLVSMVAEKPERQRAEGADDLKCKVRLGIVNAGKPRVAEDEQMAAMAQRLTQALRVHNTQKNQKRKHVGNGDTQKEPEPEAKKTRKRTIAEEWLRFLAEDDSSGSQSISLEDFDTLLRTKLKIDMSRYEVRVLHRRLDLSDTGRLPHGAIVLMMYRRELLSWPDISATRLERLAQRITNAAEKQFRSSGNWISIFEQTIRDWDVKKGTVSFQEFRQCIRSSFPGLNLKVADLSETSLQGLWKKFDSDEEMDVPVQRFMYFLRRHAAKALRSVNSASASFPGDLLESQSDAEREQAVRRARGHLIEGMRKWLAKFGRKAANADSSPSVWADLFSYRNSEASGRISFPYFMQTVKTTLQPLCEKMSELSKEDVCALWAMLDEDKSGELTLEEFGIGWYKLLVADWPDMEEQEIRKAILALNHAANHWHRAGGNWFKIFQLFDMDESGEMEFEEMVEFVRRSYPGLAVTAGELSDRSLRGMWKAMDQDQSGKLSVMEFMIFMRSHGQGLNIWQSPKSAREKRLLPKIDDMPCLSDPVPTRSKEELGSIAAHLDKAVNIYLSMPGSTKSFAAPSMTGAGSNNDSLSKWDVLLESRGYSSIQHKLTLPIMLQLMRDAYSKLESLKDKNTRQMFEPSSQERQPHERWTDELLVSRSVKCGDLRALWAHVHQECEGKQVSARMFRMVLYKLEVQLWPDAEVAQLERVVDKISLAAERWHQAGTNWYRVFNLFDEDNSGRISYEEFYDLVRRPCPCLALGPEQIPDSHLRGFWKTLDTDISGEVTVGEFIVFMKRRGKRLMPMSFRKPEENSRTEASPTAQRTEVDPRAVEFRLSEKEAALLRDRLSNESSESLAVAYEEWGIPWTATVSEWEWLRIVREQLNIRKEQIDEDLVHLVWAALDSSRSGKVDVAAILELGWEREGADGDGSGVMSPTAGTSCTGASQ